jgi:hypothetical protein
MDARARSASASWQMSPSSSAACGASSSTAPGGMAQQVHSVTASAGKAVSALTAYTEGGKTSSKLTPPCPHYGRKCCEPDCVWWLSIVTAKVVSTFSMRLQHRGMGCKAVLSCKQAKFQAAAHSLLHEQPLAA